MKLRSITIGFIIYVSPQMTINAIADSPGIGLLYVVSLYFLVTATPHSK